MTVMTDSNMCFSMKVDMPTTWQNWSKSSMKLYEIDRHYPTSSHKHTGECLHIFGKHIFLASGASGWSAPPVAWKHSSVGPKRTFHRLAVAICRLSQEPHESVWMLLNRLKIWRFWMNASMHSMLGVYNGCIIIYNNHNMNYMKLYDFM